MNQVDAQQEFAAVQTQRQECVEWLEQNNVLNALFSSQHNNDNDERQDIRQQQQEEGGSLVLDPPLRVQYSIFGNQSVLDHHNAANANEAPNQGGDDHEASTANVQQQQQQQAGNAWILRKLLPPEIQVLMLGRCRCRDWSRIWLYLPASEAELLPQTCLCLQQRVMDTGLAGTVVLVWPQNPLDNAHEPRSNSNHNEEEEKNDNDERTTNHDNDWEWLPQGLYHNAMIANSLVHLDGWVYRNSLISHCVIGSKAVVLNVGKLSSGAPRWNPFSLSLTVGPEAGGGRTLHHTTPQDTMLTVAQRLLSSSSTIDSSDVTSLPRTQWSVLSTGTVVRDTTTVISVYLHPHAAIEGASCVQQSVLFPGSRIVHGCHVQQCFLQWNVVVQDQSWVATALLMEGAHVGPHSKIGDSILGPDVAVASGEVQSSVVGPNTAAHHQSLLIGNIWCHGRGNVGYGANVGSNHTGRAPDQEAWTGEGIFWGLSTVIVYPVNLLASPYSVVAAGTKLVAQSISMPFSLIVNDGEIVPAWVLTSSPYTLARCQQKWQTRRKAMRHYHYTGWNVVDRADVLQSIHQARAILKHISPPDLDDEGHWYNTNEKNRVIGLGRCKVSERSRKRAIAAYTDCLQRSSLQGLLAWMEQSLASGSVTNALDLLEQELQKIQSIKEETTASSLETPALPRMPWTISQEETWQFQKYLLLSEFGSEEKVDWLTLLETRLPHLYSVYALTVLKSKQRDDQRGAQIIPVYEEHHISAEDDKTIIQVQQEARMVTQRIELLRKRLKLEH